MKIKVIGTGSTGNAFLIESPEHRLLFECGLTWDKLQKGYDYLLPDACFVSHSHKDHSANAIKLAVKGVPIITSPTAAKEIGLLGWQIGKAKQHNIRAYKGTHDVEVAMALLDDKVSKERLFFATDTADIPVKINGITHLMVECNHSKFTEDRDSNQISRARETHLSLEILLEWIENMDKSKLKEVHLIHLSDQNSDEKFFKEELQKATGVAVFVH